MLGIIMTIKQNNHRYQITMTPEERRQLQFLCEGEVNTFSDSLLSDFL